MTDAALTAIAGLMMVIVASIGSPAQSTEPDVSLIEAAAAGHAPTVGRLIAQGVPLEARDSARRTPLLLATRNDHVEVARLLITAGADVNAKDNIRDTPFLYAGAEGRDRILEMILATGKANLRDTNRYGGTALIPAAHHGHPETVRILLATDIDVDHVNNLGWTALLEAVILGDGGPVYQEIVGLLVDAGAKNIPDRDGKIPLEHARDRGFDAILRRIEGGARK
jgi:ankyrin repeat protein